MRGELAHGGASIFPAVQIVILAQGWKSHLYSPTLDFQPSGVVSGIHWSGESLNCRMQALDTGSENSLQISRTGKFLKKTWMKLSGITEFRWIEPFRRKVTQMFVILIQEVKMWQIWPRSLLIYYWCGPPVSRVVRREWNMSATMQGVVKNSC